MTESKPVLTARLEIRLPDEEDRERFVQLFCDRAFMVFSGGVLDHEAANRRFDQMLERAAEISFAKQPLIERSSDAIIGYSGVDRFEFEDESRLEYGYRLVPEARGRGYATEAGLAILAAAADNYRGEVLAFIDPSNYPSRNVLRKLGFAFWRNVTWEGGPTDFYLLDVPKKTAPPPV
jgi:RimJ/RimL family protein N-acetyltransferase